MFDPKEAYKYAAPDGTNTFRLYNYFAPLIEKYNLKKAEWIELHVIKAVGQIELNGIAVDVDLLKSQQSFMLDRIHQLEGLLYQLAGRTFDVNSPQQLAEVLYDELKLPQPEFHGQKSRSTGKEALDFLEGSHPIIGVINNYRGVVKLYNDFVLKLPELISEDLRLHGNLNPMGTRSGRFSASGGFGRKGEKIKLNAQQLPKGKTIEVEFDIELPDDCGLDPEKSYKTKELDAAFPGWRDYLRR